MRRARRLGTAVLALAVVLAAVHATGAFSSTSAERSADVNVAGDASAFLALEKSDGPNAAFASFGSNGALQVTMGEGSRGVNPDSQTSFQNIFTVSNRGAKPISIWFTGGSEAVTFVGPDSQSIESEGGAVTLQPGGQSLHVGLTIDSRGVEPGANLLRSVKIQTDADVAGQSVENLNNGGNGADAAGGSSVEDDNPGVTDDDAATPAQDYETSSAKERRNSGQDESSTDNDRGDNFQNNDQSKKKGSSTNLPDSFDGIPTKQVKKFSKGAALGEVGMHDGANPSNASSSPYYLVGWIGTSLAPGVGMFADARDFGQNILSGDWGEAVLDGLAFIPGAGTVLGSTKVINSATKWADEFAKKADEVVPLLAKYVLPHAPDSISVKLLDVFTDGSASALKTSGLSTDEVIDLATEGRLKKVAQKQNGNAGDSKRLVADGGKRVESDLTAANKRHIDQQGNPDETMIALTPNQKRTGNGEVVWLEKGDSASGWKHTLQRHESEFYERASISNREEIKETIYKTINKGNPKQIPDEDGGTAYQYITKSGESYTVIVGDNGYVVTARPGKSKYHA